MKKIISSFALFITSLTFGQITYESTHFAKPGASQLVSKTSLGLVSLDFTATGANYAWNYSSLAPAIQETISHVAPTSTGLRTAWCTSQLIGPLNCNTQFNNNFNIAEKLREGLKIGDYGLTNVYELSNITASTLTTKTIGGTITLQGVPIPLIINYQQPSVIYNFPLVYNPSNPTTSTSTFSVDLTNYNVPLKYTNSTQRTNVVEGWGSLVTPYGTFPSVLKMKTTLVQNIDTVINGQTSPPVTATTITYKWFDKAFGVPVLEVSGSMVGTIFIPATASYIDNQVCLSPSTAFAWSPLPVDYNPATQSATVSFSNLSINYNTSSWNFGDGTALSTQTNPDHTYTCPGVKQVTLTTTNTLCSPPQTKTLTLNVNITDSQNAYPNGVTVAGNTLTADRTLAGTIYQWVTCNSNDTYSPINGQANRSFTPTVSGNYAVQLTTNGCQSISVCNNIQILSNIAFDSLSEVTLYPNPTSGLIKISDDSLEVKKIVVYNLIGGIVGESLDISSLSSGIYYVKIETDKGTIAKKIMKI